MSDTAALAILLDAPLQAWGVSSRYQRRETELFPVKSGLVGLLAAALGIDKHSPAEAERIAPFARLRTTAYRVPKAKPGDWRKTPLDVQRLVDFHTVGGGYPDTSEGKLNVPPIAEKSKTGGLKWKTPDKRTVPTWRAYLTDARFAAVFAGDAAAVQKAAAAVADPKWGVWFGRKACLPALPLSPVVAASPGAALAALLVRLAEWEGGEAHDPQTLECWEEPETANPAEGDFFFPDTPISFGVRAFTDRPVRHRRPASPAGAEAEPGSVADAYFDAIPETE